MKPFTTSLPNLDQLSLSESPDFIEEFTRDALMQHGSNPNSDQALVIALHLAKAYTAQQKLKSAERTLRDVRARLDASSRQVQLRYLIEVTRFFLAKDNKDEAQTLWNKAKKLCVHIHDEYAEAELSQLITALSAPPLPDRTKEPTFQVVAVV
ncbi:MAG: hypothetical protein DWQ07_06840 [Chloroflexi bacterium]|nr:MAG: hypothetical protein DWQ07_06840 [Chloroflexota bacterium]MBL1195583.1 hypothetical protein [Chloroflexota bacterium]NOH12869.1 hypothetical protein [Chloroflexota bacterium]